MWNQAGRSIREWFIPLWRSEMIKRRKRDPEYVRLGIGIGVSKPRHVVIWGSSGWKPGKP